MKRCINDILTVEIDWWNFHLIIQVKLLLSLTLDAVILDNDESLMKEDYVEIVQSLFRGYYALLIGESYGDELEIQYFREKTDNSGSYRELATYDYDCRPSEDLKKIEPTITAGRSPRFIFESKVHVCICNLLNIGTFSYNLYSFLCLSPKMHFQWPLKCRLFLL